MRKYTVGPEGGTRSNPVASALNTLAVLTWIGGFILGIFIAYRLSESHVFGEDFAFTMATFIWGQAFINGLVFRAFAEIIFLLQKGVTVSYAVSAPSQEAPSSSSYDHRSYAGDAETEKVFVIEPGDRQLPFVLKKLWIIPGERSRAALRISVEWVGMIAVQGILADIEITTIYGDTHIMKDVSFTNLIRRRWDNKLNNISDLISDETTCEMPLANIGDIKGIRVIVNKYMDHGKIRVANREPEYTDDGLNSEDDPSIDYNDRLTVLLNELGRMDSARQVNAFVKELNEEGNPLITPELAELTGKMAYQEKLYGNAHEQCMKKIAEMYGYEYSPKKRKDTPDENADDLDAADEYSSEEYEDSGEPQGEYTPDDQIMDEETKKEPEFYDDPDFEVYTSPEQIPDEISEYRVPAFTDAPEASADEPVFCGNCGKKIERRDAVFCPACGTRLGE
ncbi:MAG: zinc ribbon domain-containing protein [Lachnospiraceae bacterium]|nr:zinc ribbon domain-containing protein [Lachnospiraceae bacterium]